jgi:methionyl-tRNA formyltransferase
MDLAYAGTHRFAALVLDHLVSSPTFTARHRVAGCVTTPDRPRGRRGTPQPSPLKESALALGAPLLQPERLDAAFMGELTAWGVQALVACAYGRIVPLEVLERLTSLVVHPSLVPRWRGAAPVERALMAGETELGVAIMRMTPGVDEGPVAATRTVHVPRDTDAGAAYELLAGPAAEALTVVLDGMSAQTVVWTAQAGEATYAEKLGDEDRVIDWTRPATEIADQVRALSPAIGAVTQLGGRRVLLWKTRPVAEPPSDTRKDRLVLATGAGWLEVLELQEAGKRRMTAPAYLRGAARRLAQA